jgi:hypothetical protein
MNPFDEVLEKEDAKTKLKNISSTAQNLYEHKPFFERWYKFKNASVGISYLCQIISPLPCFAVFFFLFSDQFNFIGSFSFVAAGLLAAAIAIGIEFTKRYSTKNALIEFFNYRKLNFAFGLALVCSAISIGTSFWGAYVLPQKLTDNPLVDAPILQDVDHLKTSLASSIVSMRQGIENKKIEIKEYEKQYKSSSANRLSRREGVKDGHNNLTSQLHAMEEELTTTQTNQPNTIKDALQANRDAIAAGGSAQTALSLKHEGEMQNKGLILGYISLALEGVFWATMLFVFWYFKKANVELNTNTKTSKTNSKSDKSTDKQGNSAEKEAESNSKIIGFFGNSEGHILNKSIAYEKADGTIKYYKSYQLTSMITDARKRGKIEQVERLKGLKEQLINA